MQMTILEVVDCEAGSPSSAPPSRRPPLFDQQHFSS